MLRRTVSLPAIRIGSAVGRGSTVPQQNIVFAGLAPEFAGLYQINLTLPPGDAVPIGFVLGLTGIREGSEVTIAVEPAL